MRAPKHLCHLVRFSKVLDNKQLSSYRIEYLTLRKWTDTHKQLHYVLLPSTAPVIMTFFFRANIIPTNSKTTAATATISNVFITISTPFPSAPSHIPSQWFPNLTLNTGMFFLSTNSNSAARQILCVV